MENEGGLPRAISIIVEVFEEVIDPRASDRRVRHRLVDILVISFLAVLCGADGWEDVESFGEAREGWLRSFLELPSGIPSHDTFGRVVGLIDPHEFSLCMWEIAEALRGFTERGSFAPGIAIDGKTLRGSFDRATGKSAAHLVNAYCTESGVTLGQIKVEAKSNEITAIPKLLKLLDVKGSVVTLDAMGTQRAIVEQIRDKGGEYLVCLKENHSDLLRSVEALFAGCTEEPGSSEAFSFHETVEKEHGRLEVRRYWSTNHFKTLGISAAWKDVASISMVESERTEKGVTSRETRYFLSSLPPLAERAAHYARGHWKIENGLHWTLDVVFGEDLSRVRKDHSPENLSAIRKIVIGILKLQAAKDTGKKRSL